MGDVNDNDTIYVGPEYITGESVPNADDFQIYTAQKNVAGQIDFVQEGIVDLAPYSWDSEDDPEVGDAIRVEGKNYMVYKVDYGTMSLAPTDAVIKTSYDKEIESYVESRIEAIKDEITSLESKYGKIKNGDDAQKIIDGEKEVFDESYVLTVLENIVSAEEDAKNIDEDIDFKAEGIDEYISDDVRQQIYEAESDFYNPADVFYSFGTRESGYDTQIFGVAENVDLLEFSLPSDSEYPLIDFKIAKEPFDEMTKESKTKMGEAQKKFELAREKWDERRIELRKEAEEIFIQKTKELNTSIPEGKDKGEYY